MSAGKYTDADWARLAEIEEEFRVIRDEEDARALRAETIRTETIPAI